MRTMMVIVVCLMYLVWPVDLLPDFIPVLGWIDDLAALVAAVSMLMAGAPAGATTDRVGGGGAA